MQTAQIEAAQIEGTPAEQASADEERITILASSFGQAAVEFHRRRMAEQGYRLENRIAGHKFFRTDGMELSSLFDGETLWAVTFVKAS